MDGTLVVSKKKIVLGFMMDKKKCQNTVDFQRKRSSIALKVLLNL